MLPSNVNRQLCPKAQLQKKVVNREESGLTEATEGIGGRAVVDASSKPI